jgi:hypothetical protein
VVRGNTYEIMITRVSKKHHHWCDVSGCGSQVLRAAAVRAEAAVLLAGVRAGLDGFITTEERC